MSQRILIVGGGLSGLALAEICVQRQIDFQLIEARDRLGGRIMSVQSDGTAFDLGPTWFWPAQPRIEAMIQRVGLTQFEQFSKGDAIYEDEHGQTQRARGFASMAGSWRLQGSLTQLIEALAKTIPPERIHLNTELTALAQNKDSISATLNGSEQQVFSQVILTLPPRLAANLRYEPALPKPAITAMQNIPTWMAGQAKAIAIYDHAFWRSDGLSGDAASRIGPLAEIHDASPNGKGPAALFGFIGTPVPARKDQAALNQQIQAQLIRLFGAAAANPKALILKDWAFDRFTAAPSDHVPLYTHPTYGLPVAMKDLWDNRLHFAGTEVGTTFGGYLEGALEAVEQISFELP